MFKKLILFFLVLIVGVSELQGQFGKNKVQYKEFEWKFLQSKHFDIYFSQGGYDIAQFAAAVAESSLVSLSNNLDYNITNRIPLIVFNSHNEFQQNNVIEEFLPEGVGGVTELFKNRILVPFEGNYEQFRHVIHHELVHGFINDMFYGGSLQNVISRNITLNVPIWFNEGMAEVQSLNGLDKATDMFIRDAVINNYLPPIDYCDGYLAYRGGQSFFAFLNDQYGEHKLGDLMNSIKSFGDVDLAFRETYKQSIEKLSEKWHKQLKKTYWPEIASREGVKDFAKMLTDHTKDGGFYNVAPKISPKGDVFAFISNRNDYFGVFLADINTGEVIKKIIEGNTTNDFEELQILTPGLSWSPDGKKLAVSSKAGANDAIFIIDIKSGDEYQIPVKLTSISSVTWGPDKNKIAFIGSNSKQSDLYIYDLKTKELKNLTNDIFSDYNPTWTPDGNMIIFTSDRGSFTDRNMIPKNFKIWEHNIKQRDAYSFDLRTMKISRITDTKDVYNGYVHFNKSGNKIIFVSDRNGINNLYMSEIDSSGNYSIPKALTNSLNPIDQISLSNDDKKLLFVSLNEGGYDIFSLDNPFDRNSGTDTLHLTAYRRNELLKSNNSTDTILKTSKNGFTSARDSISSLDKDISISDNKKIGINDSLKIYGSDIKINLNPTLLTSDSSLSLKSISEKRKVPDVFDIKGNFNDDGSYKVNKYKIKFSPDLVYGNAVYSSYYGVQGVAQIALSDMLGDHRLTLLTSMVIDLKNSDYAISYSYLPKRIDYSASFYHTARFVTYDRGPGIGNQLYRYRTFGGNLSLSYPINRFRRIDGSLSFMRVSRENLDDSFDPFRDDYLLIPSISFVHDNTLWGFLSPSKGTRYNITLMNSPRLTNTGMEFTSLIGDFRTYLKIADDYGMMFRFSGGASIGSSPQQFYLGGVDNWINWEFENDYIPYGESIQSYAFSMNVTPLRGYNFNAMTGSKFMMTNFELRFPLLRYLILGTLPLGFQNIQGIAFLDVGTAWNDFSGLRFVKRNESGSIIADRLLIGTGLGSRIVAFGFPFRFDIAWNYNLNKFSKPKFYFSLGLDI